MANFRSENKGRKKGEVREEGDSECHPVWQLTSDMRRLQKEKEKKNQGNKTIITKQ